MSLSTVSVVFSLLCAFAQAAPTLEVRAGTIKQTVGTYNYAGCYVDSANRVLTGTLTATDSMTLANCASACSTSPYWGIEYGRECYCGSTLSATKAADSDCSMTCSGDSSTACGGSWRIQVYSSAAGSAKTTSTASTTSTTSTASKTSTTSSTSSATTKSTSAPTTTVKNSGKRGLPYNDASLANAFATTANTQISWAYNWASSSASGSTKLSSSFEYCPMLWGLKSTSSWSTNIAAAIASGSTHALGFNEPDLGAQANMTPQQAAAAWMQYMQPYAGKIKLGAPAVTNGGAPMGLTWLTQFLGNCTACTIDFVPIHWYDSATNLGYFKWYINQALAAAGNRPIWITEFSGSGTQAQQITMLQTVMPWLDSLPLVERYAWFMASDGILTSGGVPSALGQTFMNYTSATIPSF